MNGIYSQCGPGCFDCYGDANYCLGCDQKVGVKDNCSCGLGCETCYVDQLDCGSCEEGYYRDAIDEHRFLCPPLSIL